MRWFLMTLMVLGAGGWGSKEHIVMTRMAARGLLADPKVPEGMKEWLRESVGKLTDEPGERDYFVNKRVGAFAKGVDGIAFWAVMPDLAAMADRHERKIEPFGVNERKLHFIDLEYFAGGERKYRDDLSGRPRVEDVPRRMDDPRYAAAGMLPFAVEHAYGRMVKCLREGRTDDREGVFPRDEHAAKWAGYLAHYVQDNMQPHHATVDYRSQTYFAGVAGPDVHGDLEWRAVDDENGDYLELRRDLWAEFVKALARMEEPVKTEDLWTATVEVAMVSYEALPMIGRAAREAYPEANAAGAGKWRAEEFFHYRGKYLGREMTVMQMKAHQLAWGVRRTQGVWRRGWEQAEMRKDE